MDELLKAFRNCITDRKCENRDCPYEERCRICNGSDQYLQIPKHLALDVERALAELILYKEKNKWRLCSEELPETNDEVIVTYIVNGNDKKCYVETASYFEDGDGEGHWYSIWDEYSIGRHTTEIIAWMPLPKPCRQ